MTTYAVRYEYSDDTETRMEHRPAHREFLTGLGEEGTLVAAGAFQDDGEPAALLIMRGGSADEVRELLREDPFQQQGLVTAVEVRQWEPPLGPMAEALRGD
ncbi:YciI family protein [Ornithinicoccus halotolerans]|uniref:YciI family protein n=1 Tax=Ornithinicoccus halotolerans TaxID=1748220 RepID=UPI00129558E2|nr:YciI family protein [Ornithinicoccus halotolerans]